MCKRLGFFFLDNILFLKRHHFTKHGLHLNGFGKRLLAIKLKQYLCSLVPCINEKRKHYHDSSFTLHQPNVSRTHKDVPIPDPFMSPMLDDDASEVYSIPTLSGTRRPRNEMDFHSTALTMGT